MTVSQILKKAKSPEWLEWDRKTVQEAAALREDLVPRLLVHMNWFYGQLKDPAWEPDDDAFYLLNNGCHLLAEIKETRVYPLLLQFLELPELQLDITFGDDLTEDLKDVLAGTYDGSLAETEALVLDPQVFQYARSTALQALARVCRDGGIPREELIRLIREVIRKFAPAEPVSEDDTDAVLFGAWQAAEVAHLHEVCPDMRDLVLRKVLDDEDYAYAVDHIFDWPGAPKEKWLPAFVKDDEDGPTKEEERILGYHCGRNDPCPCGSGKKYKKCCQPKQEELRIKYPNWKPKSIFEFACELRPVVYPPIENVGDEPGLAAYYPREAIAVDIHICRGLGIVRNRPIYYKLSEDEVRVATEELWEAFEGFEKICREKDYQTCDEYDRGYLVHFAAERWLEALVDCLRKTKDSRLDAVKKWL